MTWLILVIFELMLSFSANCNAEPVLVISRAEATLIAYKWNPDDPAANQAAGEESARGSGE
jgi:hypothetical protein